MLRIGPYELKAPVVLAPMAGLTDAAFRRLCLSMGAGMAVGEMASSEPHLRGTEMSRRRFVPDPEDPLPVVQIVGADPVRMGEAAAWAAECGARIVDVNFGCPSRMMCGKASGSAVLRDPEGAVRILEAVRAACPVPVTVKMRTAWDEKSPSSLPVAQAAERLGFCAVTLHGRTRAQKFRGRAEHETAARFVQALSIPVIANGDIDSPAEALRVLRATGAAGVMIGRAAVGNPWIFPRTAAVLAGRPDPGEPPVSEAARVILRHWTLHRELWGEGSGAVRAFRSHLFACAARLPGAGALRARWLAAGEGEEFGRILAQSLSPYLEDSHAGA